MWTHRQTRSESNHFSFFGVEKVFRSLSFLARFIPLCMPTRSRLLFALDFVSFVSTIRHAFDPCVKWTKYLSFSVWSAAYRLVLHVSWGDGRLRKPHGPREPCLQVKLVAPALGFSFVLSSRCGPRKEKYDSSGLPRALDTVHYRDSTFSPRAWWTSSCSWREAEWFAKGQKKQAHGFSRRGWRTLKWTWNFKLSSHYTCATSSSRTSSQFARTSANSEEWK